MSSAVLAHVALGANLGDARATVSDDGPPPIQAMRLPFFSGALGMWAAMSSSL